MSTQNDGTVAAVDDTPACSCISTCSCKTVCNCVTPESTECGYVCPCAIAAASDQVGL